jgi:DNA-binding beta-propeller fold protein YncE
MQTTRITRLALVASTILGASFAATLTASAGTLAALTGDDTLTMIDTATQKAGKSTKVTGIKGKIAGIDVRPADGMLYALAGDGTIYTIDAASGKATMKSKMDTVLAAGTMATVDFNPAADRLRVIGSDGTNLRVNVEDGKTIVDGKLKFAEVDMHKGEMPWVVAGAYSNSVKGTKETALYDIDGKIGGLLKQAPPNDGVLGAVGKLGVMPKAIAFDIEPGGDGSNTGWLLADGALHKVDLATGKAAMVGKVSGLNAPARDVAVLPAM